LVSSILIRFTIALKKKISILYVTFIQWNQ
jgi:hypothetical protein